MKKEIRYQFIIGNHKYPNGAVKKTTCFGEKFLNQPGNKSEEKEEVFDFDSSNILHVNAKLDLIFFALRDIKIRDY